MNGTTLARIGAIVFVVLATVATMVETNRHDDWQGSRAIEGRPVMDRNPLDAELTRCSAIGEAATRDPACLNAWAESRRRFLGQPTPATARTAPMTLFPGAPAEQMGPATQADPLRLEAR